MKRYFTAFYALLMAFVPAACSMHGQSSTPLLASSDRPGVITPLDTHGGIANSSDMTVVMGDASPAFSGKQLAHLNLGIQEIDVTDSLGNTQVVARYAAPFVVDVLQYQDGSGAVVGHGASAAVRTYSQVRIVIDVATSQVVYTDNSSGALNFVTNSASLSSVGAGSATTTTSAGPGQVAITVNDQFATQPNLANIIGVDFNAFESLAPAAGNALSVRPALFVAASSNAGTITGAVLNKNGKPVANATVVAFGSDGSVGNSAATDASGNFNLHTLASDTYSLQIYNSYTNAAGARQNAQSATTTTSSVIFGPTITVSPGQSASAGTITD